MRKPINNGNQNGSSGTWPPRSDRVGTPTPTVTIVNGQPTPPQTRVLRATPSNSNGNSSGNVIRRHPLLSVVLAALVLATYQGTEYSRAEVGGVTTAGVTAYFTDQLAPQIIDTFNGDGRTDSENDTREIVGTLSTPEAAALAAEKLPNLSLGAVDLLRTEGPTEGKTVFKYKSDDGKLVIKDLINARVTTESARVTADIDNVTATVSEQDPTHLVVTVEVSASAVGEGTTLYDIEPAAIVSHLEQKYPEFISNKDATDLIKFLNNAISKKTFTAKAMSDHLTQILSKAKNDPDFNRLESEAIEKVVRDNAAQISGLNGNNITVVITEASPKNYNSSELPPTLSVMPSEGSQRGLNFLPADEWSNK